MSDYEPRINKRLDQLETQIGKMSMLSREVGQSVGIKQDQLSQQGVKYDEGKPDLTILPKALLDETAKVMMYGANKYERDNYKKGFPITRTLAAALRHIYSYLDKEDNDPESGLSHLGHAAASIAMTLENIRIGTAKDDR